MKLVACLVAAATESIEALGIRAGSWLRGIP
jgi:hypothetical protein